MLTLHHTDTFYFFVLNISLHGNEKHWMGISFDSNTYGTSKYLSPNTEICV